MANVYQKLIEARALFLQEGVKKTGKNIQLEFHYFELNDIVPVATKIFKELGLVTIPTFSNEVAKVVVINCDAPEEQIEFAAPMKELQPIVSAKGNVVTNNLQLLGSEITYLRRYLWGLVLDLVESDQLDANTGNTEKTQTKLGRTKAPEKVVANVPTAPATPDLRNDLKKELTNEVDPLLLKGLKKVLVEYKNISPENAKKVEDLIIKTQNLTTLSKADIEKLIDTYSKAIQEHNQPQLDLGLKGEVIDDEAPITEAQKDDIKKLFKKLVKLDPTAKQQVQNIIDQTNGLQDLTYAQYVSVKENLTESIEELEKSK